MDLMGFLVNLDDLGADAAEMMEVSHVLGRLAAYADAKARAMAFRTGASIPGVRAGRIGEKPGDPFPVDIEAALSFERGAQATYDRLPDWAKW